MPSSAATPASSEKSCPSTPKPMPRRNSSRGSAWGLAPDRTTCSPCLRCGRVPPKARRGTFPPRRSRTQPASSYPRPKLPRRRARRMPRSTPPRTWSRSLPTPTNATAYNNYLMVESYLVVPTSGLTASQGFEVGPVHPVRRGAGGPVGRDHPGIGSPDAEYGGRRPEGGDAVGSEAATAASTSSTGSSGTSTTTTTAPTASTTAAAASSSPAVSVHGPGGNRKFWWRGTGLATTGAADIVPLLGVGGALVGLGAFGRRRVRRSRRLRRPEVGP